MTATPSIHPALLPFLAVLRIAGPDARAFLQGQLTHDTRLLADGRTQLAAVQHARRDGSSHCCACARATTASTRSCRRDLARRSPPACDASCCAPGWMSGSPTIFGSSGCAATRLPSGRRNRRRSPGLVRLCPGPAGRRRARGRTARLLGSQLAMDAAGIEDKWRSADIAAGLPQVFAASSEAFVPQMLNLDLLDAISFSKGCYTGQEIVARTQHLGRIKRRDARAFGCRRARTATARGTLARRPEGRRGRHERDPRRRVELLAVTSLEAWAHAARRGRPRGGAGAPALRLGIGDSG